MLALEIETEEMAKTIADRVKDDLKGLKKDPRYKYIVQVTMGENNG